jgi:predicted acetyltransferase
MSFEIRTITDNEVDAALEIAYQAFGNIERFDPAPAIARVRNFYQSDWYLASFEDGQMTSMMRMLPFAMRINGGALPFGAVSPVANSPLHRRKGHTGAMLRQSLELMRDRGQSLSGLYTPHPAFYRRYGWEIAADERRYTFAPKDMALTATASDRGRLREVKGDGWHELDAIYRRWAARRNGPLHRAEVWWRNSIMGEGQESWSQREEAVIWSDSAGQPQGYAVFHQSSGDEARVRVRELAAITGDAYLNLLTFIAQHDIHHHIDLLAASEDPLPLLFEDAERLTVKQGYTVLVRVVDVEAALRARPLADPELNTQLTIEVRDESAPWNEGTWRIAAESGSVVVERAKGEGELRLDATVLAPVFNGYVKPSTAAATGLLSAVSDDALERADAFFATAHRPYFPDRF